MTSPPLTATALGAVLVGLEPHPVRVTAEDAPGVRLGIRGLPDAASAEVRTRVRAALSSQGYPSESVAVAVHDLPAHTSLASLDLAIAVAVLRLLSARGDLHYDGQSKIVEHVAHLAVPPWSRATYVGELGLTGDVRPVRGAYCYVARPVLADWPEEGRGLLVAPAANAWEIGLHPSAAACTVARLADLRDPAAVPDTSLTPHVPTGRDDLRGPHATILDRCLALPRVLLVGPPGAGKTMLAARIATAAPALTHNAMVEVLTVHSAVGLLRDPIRTMRPFRAPHHTCSTAGLVGNGTRPGEVSLAHRGVLYLDELLEYRREAIGVLATVLRDGESSSRIGTRILRYPAVPAALVAAANPCPCGYRYLNDPRRRCACSPERVRAYEAQLTARAELLGLVRVDVPAIRMEDLS